ncbi:hypothetical protein ADUPG1_012638, partial [Aduncisulcus paluster]
MHHEHSFSPCTNIPANGPILEILVNKLKNLKIKLGEVPSNYVGRQVFRKIVSSLSHFFGYFASPSDIGDNRPNFVFVFEYISSLFQLGNLGTSPVVFSGTREVISIDSFLYHLLSPMLKVEMILRDKKPGQINSITKNLFRVLRNSLKRCPQFFMDIRINFILSDFIKSLIDFFKFGSSISFDEEFVEDILACGKILSVLSHNQSMVIFLDSLLPYVIPWMEKYQSQRLCGDWITIVKGFVCNSEYINVERMEKCWHLFPKLVEVIKKEISPEIPIINVKDDHKSIRSEFDFQDYFVNFLDISFYFCSCSHTAEVFDILKDSLDDIIKFVVTHRVDGHMASFLQLMSSFSAIPSIVPHILPKYDEDVLYCHRNSNINSVVKVCPAYLKYLLNCHSSTYIQKLGGLIDLIRQCEGDEAFQELFLKHQDILLEIFSSYCSSDQSIWDHRFELIFCVGCLVLFSSNEEFFFDDMVRLIFNNFYENLSRIVQVLEGEIDHEFCFLCGKIFHPVNSVTSLTFIKIIEPGFRYLFKQGSMNKLCADIPTFVLGL